jgi:hypothetical protein
MGTDGEVSRGGPKRTEETEEGKVRTEITGNAEGRPKGRF